MPFLTTNFCSQPLGEQFIVLIIAGLDQLRTESRMTQAYYYAKNSSRNVLSHIRQWLFCSIFFNLGVLPASIDDVILFVELMAISAGYDHIKNVIGSITFLHKVLDLPFEMNLSV